MARTMTRKRDPMEKLPAGKWTRVPGGLPDVPLLIGAKTPTGRLQPPAEPAVLYRNSVTVPDASPVLGVRNTVTVPQTRPTITAV